ncbi:MAG: LytTR family DNA-binding domain-containing protein [Gemmatimonadota bacterium]
MRDGSQLRVLVVDDEPLGRQRLEDLLAREPGVELVASVGDGRAAVEAVRELRPDLLLLDVQMPGMSGLEVAREVGPEAMPVTVFVTAYDRYALRAFELAALDYLLKPFDDERFAAVFGRAREAVRMRRLGSVADRLVALLHGDVVPAGPSAPPVPPPEYLERIAVESRGRIRVLPVERIDYVTASGPYAELHVGGETHLIRERMAHLEERLDPRRFFRVHRSAIVQLDRVETVHSRPGGEYTVQLRGGVRLPVSRSRREELARRLGLAR